MSLLRILDSLFKLYLAVHLVLGICLDSQSVLPHEWYPRALIVVVDDYVKQLGDPLVRNSPPWFKALVWMELLVQMPCSIALLYGYAQRKKWLRALGSLYAVHVLTTMPPLYMHFESVMKVPHKYCVEAIYAPWVVLPLLMLLRYACGAPPGTSRKRPSQSGSEGVARKKSM